MRCAGDRRSNKWRFLYSFPSAPRPHEVPKVSNFMIRIVCTAHHKGLFCDYVYPYMTTIGVHYTPRHPFGITDTGRVSSLVPHHIQPRYGLALSLTSYDISFGDNPVECVDIAQVIQQPRHYGPALNFNFLLSLHS